MSWLSLKRTKCYRSLLILQLWVTCLCFLSPGFCCEDKITRQLTNHCEENNCERHELKFLFLPIRSAPHLISEINQWNSPGECKCSSCSRVAQRSILDNKSLSCGCRWAKIKPIELGLSELCAIQTRLKKWITLTCSCNWPISREYENLSLRWPLNCFLSAEYSWILFLSRRLPLLSSQWFSFSQYLMSSLKTRQ